MQVFFVDESGDPGWGRDSSPFLVIVAVTANEPTIVRRAVADLHRKFNIRDEIKCSRLCRDDRIRALRLLLRYPVHYYAVAIDKDGFQRHFPEYAGKPTAIYFHGLQVVFRLIADNAVDDPQVVLDEPKRRGVPREIFQCVIDLARLPPGATIESGPGGTVLRVPMGSTRKLRQITGFIRSDHDLGIQAADLLAGTLRQWLVERDLRLRPLLRRLEKELVIEPQEVDGGVAVHACMEATTMLKPGTRSVTMTQSEFALTDPR